MSPSERSDLPGYFWIKFPISYLDDPGFMRLSPVSTRIFILLYLLAGKADSGGLICSSSQIFNLDDLSWLLRCPTDELAVVVDELLDAGLLARDGDGFRISRFEFEQGPSRGEQRAAWRERQRLHRSRLQKDADLDEEQINNRIDIDQIRRSQTSHRPVTECHGDVTVTGGDGGGEKTTLFKKIYQEEINTLITARASNELQELADKYPISWFNAAIHEAVVHNVRNLKYVKTILYHWQQDGSQAPRRVDEGLQTP